MQGRKYDFNLYDWQPNNGQRPSSSVPKGQKKQWLATSSNSEVVSPPESSKTTINILLQVLGYQGTTWSYNMQQYLNVVFTDSC